jgi:acyl-CoA thioester hydrolase
VNAQRYRYDIQVRFCDIDGLGHINNAVYHSYVEMCRTSWLDEALGYKVFSQGERVPIILARTEMDYLKQGFLHDRLHVDSYIVHIGQKSFHQAYEVSNGRDVIARAKAVLVWFDFDQQQSIPIPEQQRQRMQSFLLKE